MTDTCDAPFRPMHLVEDDEWDDRDGQPCAIYLRVISLVALGIRCMLVTARKGTLPELQTQRNTQSKDRAFAAKAVDTRGEGSVVRGVHGDDRRGNPAGRGGGRHVGDQTGFGDEVLPRSVELRQQVHADPPA